MYRAFSTTDYTAQDGVADQLIAALQARLVGCDACLADCVNNGNFQPPPDGVVDAADLAYLLGAWGPCSEGLTGGGEGMAGGENSEGGAGPFDGTYLGMLLEELLATNDAEMVPSVLQALFEWVEQQE